MVSLLMIRPRFNVTGLFKENLFEYFDVNNALLVDSSTSVCDTNSHKPLSNIAHLALSNSALLPSIAGVIGMVLSLMIRHGFNVIGLFKEKLFEYFDINNALFVNSSTSVCDIKNPNPLPNIARLAWLKFGLAPVLCWCHWHGAAIDDTTRI